MIAVVVFPALIDVPMTSTTGARRPRRGPGATQSRMRKVYPQVDMPAVAKGDQARAGERRHGCGAAEDPGTRQRLHQAVVANLAPVANRFEGRRAGAERPDDEAPPDHLDHPARG